MRILSFKTFTLAIGVFILLARQASADEPKSEYFEVDGVKIHYITAGEGEPVILIHGLYSSSATNWRLPGVFGALAKNHQVVAIDLPGHGLSDKPDSAEAYGEQLVEDVVALMDHLKIKKAHVAGYSMGGMVSMKLMAKYPDRLISVAVCGMGWLREGSPQQRLWARMPGGRINETPISFVHGMAELAITKEELKAIQTPVEVIVGDEDPIQKFYVEPLKEVRSDWNIVEIPAAGHLICVIKPEFRDAVVDWIKANSK
jgi:pimeloyl-ACP methyl ester carboxylesterase